MLNLALLSHANAYLPIEFLQAGCFYVPVLIYVFR